MCIAETKPDKSKVKCVFERRDVKDVRLRIEIRKTGKEFEVSKINKVGWFMTSIRENWDFQ